ncbi:DUF896 domain-containing protein [Clostridium tetani]|uniref:UPF0291 protein DP131_13195 n=1 Tax=Clostridium tetani TaxID=1513 RepID=A0ABY0ENQ2_CLOTA|nr:DUF896 domain-containing protein [Clostridium tetani]CDI49822.1 protein YlaC [Clostridium tetani 12124569]KHO38918.1 hypothetical protein OR62_08895 [Clostridium tetani]RXI37489.1 DUF896 family protein [Clostridium tetani]RXI52055.1 DUF896 family protein [Clostridium tetani]RXI67971.1 DUF896 family protein [Clostridium tetani]
MKIEELIEKINYLYKKDKDEGLTEEEKIEQAELREKYLQNIRNNFRVQLESIGGVSKKKSKN